MKTFTLITAGTLYFGLAGCSTAAEPPAGAAGSPPATAGTGGAPAAAGSGNTAGATTGGAPSSAGSGNDAGASAGAAGATAGSGGAAPVVDVTLAKDWDGALLKYPCGDGNPNYDCKQPT